MPAEQESVEQSLLIEIALYINLVNILRLTRGPVFAKRSAQAMQIMSRLNRQLFAAVRSVRDLVYSLSGRNKTRTRSTRIADLHPVGQLFSNYCLSYPMGCIEMIRTEFCLFLFDVRYSVLVFQT